MKTSNAIGFGAIMSAGLLAVNVAGANTITQTLDYGSSGSPLTNPISDPLAFNQFNTSLGTLTSVTISFSDNSAGTVQITNNGSSTGSFAAGLNEKLSLYDPNSIKLASYTDIGSSSGYVNIASNGSYTFNQSASGSSPLTTLSSNLGEFEGNSTITLTLNGTATASITGPTPYNAITLSQSYGTATVTYTYAVPEPGTGVLLMGGFLAVGGLVLRRRTMGSTAR